MSETSQNPYVGPRTFTDKDRYFYGRNLEARDLLALVVSEKLVLFYAQSGAGKSSLIHARLAPDLRERGFEVLPIARVSGELPEGVDANEIDNVYAFHLLLSLNDGLPEALRQPAQALIGQTLANFMRGDAEPPPDEGDEVRYELIPYVLIIDQFEELFTHHQDRWSEREDFLQQVAAAMAQHPNLWVVLSMREDYVAALEPYAALFPDHLRARFYMQRLTRPAALEAIREPARMGGRPFDPDVAEDLVDNLRRIRVQGQREPLLGQFVEPVQLQVVCFRLWESLDQRTPPAERITTRDVQELGDVETALAQFYESTIADTVAQTGVAESELRNWFERQVITEAGTRGMVYRGEEHTGGLSTAAADFMASRFLLRPEARAGAIWFELRHDRLIEPVRASNAAWRRTHQSPLQVRAQAWHDEGEQSEDLLRSDELVRAKAWAAEHDAELTESERRFLTASQDNLSDLERQVVRWSEERSPGFLVRGQALGEVEAWAAAHEDELSAIGREFLQASRREWRQTRRMRWLAVGAMAFALVALIAASVAWWAVGQQTSALAAAKASEMKAKSENMTAQALAARAQNLAALACIATATSQPTPTATVTPTPFPLPRIEVFESDKALVDPGEAIALTWRVSGAAVKVYLDGVGVETEEKLTLYLTESHEHTLRAENPGGAVEQVVGIKVVEAIVTPTSQPCPPPQILLFEATSTTVVRGESTTLTWNVARAERVYLNGVSSQ